MSRAEGEAVRVSVGGQRSRDRSRRRTIWEVTSSQDNEGELGELSREVVGVRATPVLPALENAAQVSLRKPDLMLGGTPCPCRDGASLGRDDDAEKKRFHLD
jgi:hypothetical protein